MSNQPVLIQAKSKERGQRGLRVGSNYPNEQSVNVERNWQADLFLTVLRVACLG